MPSKNLQPQNPDFKDQIFQAAVAARATDIHIDFLPDAILIRFRVDGRLQTWLREERAEYDSLVSQFKAVAELDITKHNIPQGGHFLWLYDPGRGVSAVKLSWDESIKERRVWDVRISIFPTVYGEAAVMRLFNRPDILLNIADLGLLASDLDIVRNMIQLSHGMILVSGPTSAGKTTTIYSFLNHIANSNQNIVTLEDPVEYYLSMVRQSQIDPTHGYSYAEGIRAILRQDPDIIMVGEIRDFETAENAFRASLTGRLVFSTLHASDTLGIISRLLDMKVEASMVAYALKGVISQRLVRKICDECRVPYEPAREALDALALPAGMEFTYGKGCAACNNSGFFQRTALFEILPMEEHIQRMIIKGVDISEIRNMLRQKGFKTLRQDGVEKIKLGVTTPEEVLAQTSGFAEQGNT